MKTQIFTYIKYTGMLLCSALLLSSCSKEDGPGNESEPDEKEQQYQTDIYVAGYESNGRVLMPKCWKNGVPIDLEVGSQGAELYAMTVDGEDIYLAGYTWDSKGWDRIAMYWKNGKAVELIKGRAYAIAVENGDVYAAGTHNIDPVYWKNEKLITLRSMPGNEYIADIAVDGSDVHTVVRRFPGPGNISEVGSILYSKNGGTLNTLSANGVAFAIALNGDDVYVVGTEWNGSNSVAKYWKNGTAVALSNKSANTVATAITVDRGDVYIAGTETALDEPSIAKYWKNTHTHTPKAEKSKPNTKNLKERKTIN